MGFRGVEFLAGRRFRLEALFDERTDAGRLTESHQQVLAGLGRIGLQQRRSVVAVPGVGDGNEQALVVQALQEKAKLPGIVVRNGWRRILSGLFQAKAEPIGRRRRDRDGPLPRCQ